jgi:hypothetical protein
MTGGGDTSEIEDIVVDEDLDVGDEQLDLANYDTDDTVEGDDIAPPIAEPDLMLNPNDPIPSAGGADIGGRAGGDD